MDPLLPAVIPSARLRIRCLAPGDEALLQETFSAAGDAFLPTTGFARPAPDAAAREIRAAAQSPGREVALLELADGAPVGAAGWWADYPEPAVALMGMLMIVPAHRRRGLAREALEALGRWLAAAGVVRLRAAAGYGDRAAQDALRALGFRELDERRHVSLEHRMRLMIGLWEREISP